MKLLNFRPQADETDHFGVLVNGFAVSFAALQLTFSVEHEELSDIEAYLEAFPRSEDLARELSERGKQEFSQINPDDRYPLDQIKILPPIPQPAALIDFALSPEHLKNSSLTLFKNELKWPARSIMSWMVKRNYKNTTNEAGFKCYKGNHNSIIGDMDSPIWPAFSSYLDVEAELGVIVGNVPLNAKKDQLEKSIVGYVVFNDFSARDVQWPELIGRLGLARSKDFEKSNGLGPFLVTADEVPNPLSLEVVVKIGDRYEWKGNTAGYVVHPMDVIEYLTRHQSIATGTIFGMGTVPGCCGLDRDEWILPGEFIEISFSKLGTLRQKIPCEIMQLDKSRWKSRPELQQFVKR